MGDWGRTITQVEPNTNHFEDILAEKIGVFQRIDLNPIKRDLGRTGGKYLAQNTTHMIWSIQPSAMHLVTQKTLYYSKFLPLTRVIPQNETN
jgi:hypothetical protein